MLNPFYFERTALKLGVNFIHSWIFHPWMGDDNQFYWWLCLSWNRYQVLCQPYVWFPKQINVRCTLNRTQMYMLFFHLSQLQSPDKWKTCPVALIIHSISSPFCCAQRINAFYSSHMSYNYIVQIVHVNATLCLYRHFKVRWIVQESPI